MNAIEIKRLYDAMVKLAGGIDPTTDMMFSNDTILNNRVLQIMFSETSSVLYEILDEKYIKRNCRHSYKELFHLDYHDKQKYLLVFSEGVTISKFVYKINECFNSDMMKKLKAMEITEWLVREKYLEFRQGDNFDYKVATKQGNDIGITTVIKQNAEGESYSVNIYDVNAQVFLLKNINRITGYDSSCCYDNKETIYGHQRINW